MLPRERDYRRAARRIEVALESAPITADEAVLTMLEASADLLAITGACWHHSDPASGMPTTCVALGEPPGSFEDSLVYEFERADVNCFRDLQTRRAPVAAISSETNGEPATSARFREMIAPAGAADELRISLHDSFGLWSSLCVFSSRAMTAADLRFTADIVPVLTRTVRVAYEGTQPAAATAADDGGGPSVLILSRSDRIVAADATARSRLARLPESRDVQVPGVIAFLAAQVRWTDGGAPATVRTRTADGVWFTLDGSRLDENGSVAVVIQPSSPDAVLEAVLRSRGLTAREREVAALIIQGRSAKAIASTLVLSPWTVQDHMKAIYEKTGVTDRYTLAALAA